MRILRTNIKRLSVGAAVLGLALGGTSLTLINQAQASTGGQAAEQTQTSNSINLSQSDAINKFNEKYGSKSIKGIELKNKKNKYIYEVEGFDSEKEYKVKIDASSGNILKAKSENLDADDKEDALDLNGLISRSEATKLA
nr:MULTISPECIES: PepSY domain-containing protein [Lactobacillus]